MSHQRQIKGQWAEQFVQNFLQDQGYIVLASNLRTPWAQVDLVVRSPKARVYIIEVKFLSESFPPEQRLGRIQSQRLQRARQFLSGKYRKQVGFGLALVSSSGKIEFINLDES